MHTVSQENIAMGYTLYSLLYPEKSQLISIQDFAAVYQYNLNAIKASMPDMEQNKTAISEEKAEDILKSGIPEAEEIINNKEKMDNLLNMAKEKKKSLPKFIKSLKYIPDMVRLVNSYSKNEYTDISKGKLAIIISALIYLISPIDLIPDILPIIGWIDDAMIVSVCIKHTGPEIEKYLQWRENNGMDNKETED